MSYRYFQIFHDGVIVAPDKADVKEIARRRELLLKAGLQLDQNGAYPSLSRSRLCQALNTLTVRGSCNDIEQFLSIYCNPYQYRYGNHRWCIGFAARCRNFPVLELMKKKNSPFKWGIDSQILNMVFLEKVPKGYFPEEVEQLLESCPAASDETRRQNLEWLLDYCWSRYSSEFALEARLSDQKQAMKICQEKGICLCEDDLERLFCGRSSSEKKRYYSLLKSVAFQRRCEILLELAALAKEKNIQPVITLELCGLLEWDSKVIFTLAGFGRFGGGKLKFLKDLVDQNQIAFLRQALEAGMLKSVSVRDGLIDYASASNKTEILTMLLDWTGKYADLKKEQENRRKRQEARLMEKPDSAAALKRIWTTKKLKDGTWMITSYKNRDTDIPYGLAEVPAKIGKSPVTVLGNYAFAGQNYSHPIDPEIAAGRKVIKSVIIPEGICQIDEDVFYQSTVENVILPKSLSRVNLNAFLFAKNLNLIILRNPNLKIVRPRNSSWRQWDKNETLHIFVPENSSLEKQLAEIARKNEYGKNAFKIYPRSLDLLEKMQAEQEARARHIEKQQHSGIESVHDI